MPAARCASATTSQGLMPGLKAATTRIGPQKYLDAIISVRLVDGISGAIEHINTWSSAHTEAVIAEDPAWSSGSSPRSIRRSSCTMPRRNSPTRRVRPWAARSASPPADARPRPVGVEQLHLVQVSRARHRTGAALTTPNEVNARYLSMPHVESGMAVGLFGGSFNPPHDGHALVAENRFARLRLDQLWWMVTARQSAQGPQPSRTSWRTHRDEREDRP